jgi:hypothetical protein
MGNGLTISSNGLVGIGNSAPVQTLDVIGNITNSGSLGLGTGTILNIGDTLILRGSSVTLRTGASSQGVLGGISIGVNASSTDTHVLRLAPGSLQLTNFNASSGALWLSNGLW